jgi:hypothetical protein
MSTSSIPVVRRKVPALGGRAMSSRRGLSFCYTLIVLSAMLILGAVFLHIGLNSAKWAYSHYRQQQSLFLAEAAIDRAIWMMEANSEGTDGINVALDVSAAEAAAGVTRTYESPVWQLASGSYKFVATSPHKRIPGTVEIRAQGTSRRNSMTEGVFAVLRPERASELDTYTYTNASCFGYAMLSDHNLVINGNPTVHGGLHANGDLHFNGTAAEVYGPVSALNVYGTFTQIPEDAGLLQRETGWAPVSMPKIDLPHYEAVADEIHQGGWILFNNGLSSPSWDPADPKIIFADGKVKLAGNFDGVGMIVSTKGFEVTGNVTYASPGSTWAFVTTGDFKVAGTAQINGGIYCHNISGTAEFIGHGTPNIFGCVVSDVIQVTGDYMIDSDNTIRDVYDLPGMMEDFGPPVVDILAWERD